MLSAKYRTFKTINLADITVGFYYDVAMPMLGCIATSHPDGYYNGERTVLLNIDGKSVPVMDIIGTVNLRSYAGTEADADAELYVHSFNDQIELTDTQRDNLRWAVLGHGNLNGWGTPGDSHHVIRHRAMVHTVSIIRDGYEPLFVTHTFEQPYHEYYASSEQPIRGGLIYGAEIIHSKYFRDMLDNAYRSRR